MQGIVQSSPRRCDRGFKCAAALIALACLSARPAVAALDYGFLDPQLVLDTRTKQIWLPVDATNDDVARLGALGTDLHFPALGAWRALWASNFGVPVPIGDVRELDDPLDPDLIHLMEFMGGGLTESCHFGEPECYSISGWSAGNDGAYQVIFLDYWASGPGSAIASVSTLGGYP